MIVVDTNIIAYLYLPGEKTNLVEKLLIQDSEWAVPYLWRSEFRNVLAGYIRRKIFDLETTLQIIERAETQFKNFEYFVPSGKVMKLVAASSCSAYDCEFVALAQDLSIPMFTADKKILDAFPEIAIPLK